MRLVTDHYRRGDIVLNEEDYKGMK
ncbi:MULTISPECIES: hypothetical protein [Streptococcus]|uniref:Uncharacterized protein n=1 Tax=Streptococcus macedonicus TaxID=59310 RepID=A0A2G3NX84_STRMC|nr:hypothetical protein [Streptococcus macedonicus]PHV58098.1 hypothetical protein CS010_02795 [Streptococcus macedonicus]PHV58227.1 hypothetical protein CS009_03405 [Streptococcus macedonicus]PHV60113.1 hypothetical protein CS005_05445 [Streptococcus macedonicus]